jgi:hypothetical protein
MPRLPASIEKSLNHLPGNLRWDMAQLGIDLVKFDDLGDLSRDIKPTHIPR